MTLLVGKGGPIRIHWYPLQFGACSLNVSPTLLNANSLRATKMAPMPSWESEGNKMDRENKMVRENMGTNKVHPDGYGLL